VSPGFLNQTALGDITIVTKAVLAEDNQSGNLLSGGMAITAPTGSLPFSSTTTGVSLHSTLLQPYVGHIWRQHQPFLQGFSSLIAPTASNDVTLLANDLALGYQLDQGPRCAFLSAVVPVFEAHLNTPLNHRGTQVEPAGYVDQLTLLGGLHGVFR